MKETARGDEEKERTDGFICLEIRMSRHNCVLKLRLFIQRYVKEQGQIKSVTAENKTFMDAVIRKKRHYNALSVSVIALI